MAAKDKILNFMREEAYRPMTGEELINIFEIPTGEREHFLELLNQMEASGLIIKNRRDSFGVPERMDLAVGYLEGNPKGFGFLIADESDQEDIYINPNDMNGAMHNDRVIVRINKLKEGRKASGEVIRILERANKRIIGNYEASSNFGFVVPDDARIFHDVFVSKNDKNAAKDGQKVVVEIVNWPENRRNPEGKIVEVLGYKGEVGVDIEAIIRRLDLPNGFPQEVKDQVEKISEKIDDKELERRRDLTSIKMVTIDGEDAKDFDDAVSIERLDNNIVRLGVHIADVTYYVKEGSALDKEALNRGTSIYLVDRVIPMLPQKLSNNLCSLRSNTKRLAMSVLMDFNLETGELLKHEIVESVINVNHRLTYTKVKKMLVDEDQNLINQYSDMIDDLRLLAQLSRQIREDRFAKGSIDFNFPEAKIILDDDGKPVDIVKVERTIAEKLIEDFMIKTNEVIAEEMYYREIPFIYRVHDQPGQEDLEDLNSFIHNLGYHIKGLGSKLHPKALQTVLENVSGEPEERVVNTVVLRTMQKAHYSPDNIGHFGLASEFYSHFTSPIRRYPDLMIHRIIKEVINKGVLSEARIDELNRELDYITDHSSTQERKAMDAERDTLDLKKVEYMKEKIGERYQGIISGVMSFGFFVELDNTVEGLVHVSNMLDDYYHYHEDKQAFIGERTGNIYQLGDEVEIEVSKVDLENKEIDFDLING